MFQFIVRFIDYLRQLMRDPTAVHPKLVRQRRFRALRIDHDLMYANRY
jgi:hypothetical protein